MKTVSTFMAQHNKDVTFLARRYTVRAIKTLYEVMMDKKELGANRIHAADILLKRGWGTPDKPINALAKASADEIREAARKLRGQVTVISDKTVIAPDGSMTTSGLPGHPVVPALSSASGEADKVVQADLQDGPLFSDDEC